MPVPAQAFDSEAAQAAFKKCTACHTIGPEAKNKVGPHLNGLDGRPVAGLADYKYSKAFRKAGEEGRVWDGETLKAFLEKPKSFIKGTKMSFGGIRKAQERENLVSWLIHFDANGKELSEAVNFSASTQELLGESAASIEGDPEYGQYLSGECVTCHKPFSEGEGEGIPPIVGWQKEDFIHALYLYKEEVRENPVMRTVTKRLGDEEMAALAAYFGSLEEE